jgi:hypothetical protein
MGGNAFKDVGAIHIDEILPTLNYISEKTKIFDVCDRVLGSTGKKEYSGDMDLVIDPKAKDERESFILALRREFGETNVKKLGQLVTTRIPIQKYNPAHDKRRPRTGFVQVDFMFGNTQWLKLFFHSPSAAESTLKGTHRNLAISAVAGFVDRSESVELDSFNRPVEILRWKWSPNDGLVQVRRTSRKNERTGEWIKKQDDEMLTSPEYMAENIAKILFKGKVDATALNSAESVIAATKLAYDEATQSEIYERIAFNFKTHRVEQNKQYVYPPEIMKFMEKDSVS